MGGIAAVSNGMQLTWDGPAGYYQIYQKSNSLTAPWIALGKATNLNRIATVTTLYSNAFFRVAGPAPKYAGYKVCISCHLTVCSYVTNTPHATAFSNPAFKAYGGQTNAYCLPCHTVGYGLPTGFSLTNRSGVITYATNLAGVQCENCHGPAANHAGAEDDITVRPRVEIAATLCGGCHTDTYNEWRGSEHGAVTPDALARMSQGTNNITSCGACHSGSVRTTLYKGQNPVSLTNDLNVALSCVVCHDPHQTNANPAQLRGPLFSTNDFHLYSTNLASAAAFTNKYYASANINLCAQCHNDRGAAWTDTARAPHHSVQYNMLMGSIGVMPAGYSTFNPASHAGLPSSAVFSTNGTFYLTNQCASCHMPASGDTHNHSFTASTTVCLNCHQNTSAQTYWSDLLSNQVSMVVYNLNRWSATKAPASLVSNGVVAWEYTTPGGLTWQTNAAGNVISWSLTAPVTFTGPNAAGQSLLLTNYPNILKARFNLYLYANDGSGGVHNPLYMYFMLNNALTLVSQELNK